METVALPYPLNAPEHATQRYDLWCAAWYNPPQRHLNNGFMPWSALAQGNPSLGDPESFNNLTYEEAMTKIQSEIDRFKSHPHTPVDYSPAGNDLFQWLLFPTGVDPNDHTEALKR